MKQEKKIIGKVKRVNGPVIIGESKDFINMLDIAEVGEEHLIGEIVRIQDNHFTIQVYEDTTLIRPGDNIYGIGMPLSVELGPGLIGNIYDGIQRPLEDIRKLDNVYIKRGIQPAALSHAKKWSFKKLVQKGDPIKEGQIMGHVQETSLIKHKIMVPMGIKGIVEEIKEGDFTIDEIICRVKTDEGIKEIPMYQRWPIRISRKVEKRLLVTEPLITGQRVIDTLFPIAKGGVCCVPGGFGTGKTMVQHQLAKYSNADIIVYIGCGERGNEMTDVLLSFPELIDPNSGKPLMERTILIANTSNMPVAAREASIYTGVTIAEYYRDMGYNVAIMADSTSRWAEALRELSGRMEEMPADEGFPAYLPSKLAEFYERAGKFQTLSNSEGSITIIGAVSPPGGDFSEPVTLHTKRFTRALWALDRRLANERHYPAISWLESYSEYLDTLMEWWEKHVDVSWSEYRTQMMGLLQQEIKLLQVVKLVGPDALPDSQKFIIEICTLFKNGFLQQSAYDKIDQFCTIQRQFKMLKAIILFYRKGLEYIRGKYTIQQVKSTEVYHELYKMKYSYSNTDIANYDELIQKIEHLNLEDNNGL